jgi:hypothetical protein
MSFGFSLVHVGVRIGRSFGVEHSNFVSRRSRSSDGATRQQAHQKDSDSEYSVSHVNFPVDLTDGNWHQVAVAVQTGGYVTLYVDCYVTARRQWRQQASANSRSMSRGIDEGVISIGKSFIENSRYPRYEVTDC